VYRQNMADAYAMTTLIVQKKAGKI